MREDLALICVAALGGVWAVAWGNRRAGVPDKDRMVDVRTQLQVRLDALRARAVQLRRHPDLPATDRSDVDQVIEHHVLIDSVLAAAGSAEEVERLGPQVDGALRTLEAAAARLGVVLPADDPFAGLCGNDPQHGAAETDDPGAAGRRVCRRCREKTDAGTPPARRLVSVEGTPVPFDAAPTDHPVPGV